MTLGLGTSVRMKSGTEGWIRGEVVEYSEIIPSVGGVIYTGPGYKVKVLEGKHKGEVIRFPANYVQPIEAYTPSEERLLKRIPQVDIKRLDVQYSIKQLREMAKSAGVSPTGLKEDLIQRLLDEGVLR